MRALRLPLFARTLLLAAVLVAAVATAGAGTAAARAVLLDLRQPLVAATAPRVPGLASTAPTAQALAAELAQSTGLAPAQVTAMAVCPAPAPQSGQAQCAAQAVVRRSDHARVRPRIHARATFTQVFPTRRAGIGAVSQSSPAAAPSAGTPGYLQQAYDLTYLSQTAGGSDTVAVVDAYDDPTAASDLATYRNTYGLPPCTVGNGCFTKVNETGTGSPLPGGNLGWEEEESLDLDAVSALCPNCKILLVETTSNALSDLDAGIATAQALGADQISNSWDVAGSAPAGVSSFPGATVVAATGDHGYPGAGVDDYPAAFPGITAAGGTELSGATDPTSTRGFSESAWSLNSSGAGWGGASGCDLSEAKPSWQSDTGCSGRAYADLSADADPDTGLLVDDSGNGGWLLMGGTSLSTPLIAAYEAVTGVAGASAQWAYSDSALLNDPATGTSGTCAAAILYICNAGTGYDGPTGIGSISGDVTVGAPGIGGPAVGDGSDNTYAQTVGSVGATLSAGVYPNGLDTTTFWEYGTTTAYGQQTAATDAGAGQAPVAAAAALTGLTPSTTYHYRLVAVNSAGTTYGYDYSLTTAPPGDVAPINTVAPAVSGTAQQGQALTATAGTWNPTSATLAYQWQRSPDGGATWTAIAGATSASYTAAAADVGDDLRIAVSATNAYGTSTAASALTGPVTSGAPANTSAPAIVGSPDQGQVLSVVSTWNPAGATYAYQWQRSSDGGVTWSAIGAATASEYTLAGADTGTRVRVTVTAVNPYGQASATSPPVGPIDSLAPLNTSPPTVSGTDQRTDLLTATLGVWSGPGLGFGYQWQRSTDGTTWTAITAATAPTYTLQVADEGDELRVVVTAVNVEGSTSTASAPTVPIASYPPANASVPTITGIAERGSALTAGRGTWTGPGNVYAYQWQEDFGEGFVAIAGATTGTYTPSASDEGDTLRVVVTATNPDGVVMQASQPTAAVADAVPVDSTVPTIAGTAQRSATLTESNGTWAGVGNVYSVQWQRSPDGTTWTNISGQTAPTYAVGVADEGSQLRALVTATNPDGVASAASVPTAMITAAPPVNTSPPAISGVAERGVALSATAGAWTGLANAYSFQWQRSADGGTTWTAITAATGPSYTPQVADEGDALRAQVTAVNPDATVTATSAATADVIAAPAVNTAAPGLSGTARRSDGLSATVGSWTGIGNSYGCQWQRSADGGVTWTNISGAVGYTYTLGVADEGMIVRALVTATNADGPVGAASVPSSTVLGAPPVDTVAPTITGAAVRGTLITSTPGTWSGVGNSIAYQWQRSSDGTTWTNIAAATGYTYTLGLADEGDEVRLLVTATNPDATVSAATTATTTVAASPPSATSSPMISGTAQRGLTLTSTAGGWDGLGNVITDQWQRSGDSGATWTAIAGATAPSYTLTVADEGDDVRLLVSATNPDGSVGQASAPSAPVTAAPPVETAPPTVTGIPQRTATLGSTLGTWTGVGDAYTFQWQRSADSGATWTNIAGATSATYAVGVGDETCELRLVVTAFNADATVSAASAATAAVPSAPPVNTTAPVITGTAQRGDTLIATTGTWGGIGDTTSQQWQRSSDSGVTWTAIPGATGTSYALTVADEGDEIRIVVTATNPDATVNAASAASAAVTASLPADSTAPTVAGTPQRGSALTLAPGTWTGNGVTFSDQWQRSGDGGTTWTAIAGATGTAYTPVVGDEGDQLRVLVTGTDPDGSATAPSAALATVTSSPPQVAIAPTLSGAAQRLSTLTATGGTWAGVGNTYADQWQRSPDGGATWTDIAGATASTYASAVADEGDTVRVVVTATNPDGTASAASAASGVVQSAPPVNTTPPAITGIPKLGAILSAGPGAWSPAGDTYDYTWQRGDPADGYQPIAGATGPTYALAAADVGESVEVTVTATNADGAVSATSPATATVTQPPHDTIAPTVPSGTPMQGSVLTADDGTWDSTVTFIDAWLRCPATATVVTPSCVHVGSGQTYTPGAQDVGSSLAVTVTASSPGGSSSATSPLTAIVAGQPLTDLTPPNISGNPQPPQVLSAGPGTWSVPLVTATYDWERCDPDGVSNCTQVAARASQYTLSAADDGHTIVLVANVTSPGRAATAQSAPLTVEDQPLPQVTVLPAITGTTTRTYALSATNGSWTNSPTAVTYQWQRCDATGHNCQNIAGATDTRYTLVAADEGFTITVTVTAANSTGSATAAATPTAAVAPLPPSVTRAPSLSAAAVQQGVAVSVAGAAWNATADTTYATSWERCDAGGGSCQVIAGATSAAYMPVGADVGHTLIAVITATNPDGSVPAATGASQVVLPASPRWHDLPVLSAAGGVVGTPLSITPGVWTGPVVTSDTTEVMRCTSTCVAVSSAGTYTILPADVGAILRLRETASNAGGTAVVWSAQYVGPVQSASAAAAVLLDGDAVLRNANGTALAVAQMSSGDAVAAHAVLAARGSRFGAGNGSAAGSGGAAGAGAARVITVRRARGVRGRLRAWACATTGGGAAGPPPCTRQLSLGSVGRLTLPDAMTGRVRVVVVRQRR